VFVSRTLGVIPTDTRVVPPGMRRWIIAGLVASSHWLAASGAHAAQTHDFSLANAVRMPKTEAIGAAIGAVTAVNLATYIRNRRAQRKR
jgi:hypothetical protein